MTQQQDKAQREAYVQLYTFYCDVRFYKRKPEHQVRAVKNTIWAFISKWNVLSYQESCILDSQRQAEESRSNVSFK